MTGVVLFYSGFLPEIWFQEKTLYDGILFLSSHKASRYLYSRLLFKRYAGPQLCNMRKITYFLSACLLAVVFISSRVIFYHITVPFSVVYMRTPSHLRERGYLTEDEALQDEPITDIKDAVFPRYSTVKLKDNKHSYKIGDSVYLSIILKDGYHNRRTKGGDLLRVRIFNTDLQASAAGYVTDHKDGSYTAEVDALWPGKHTISLSLTYRREAIRALYALQWEHMMMKNINGLFDNGKIQEETICHPRREGLPQYQKICNFTMNNGGMSWYCGKPDNTTFLCEDWTSVRSNKSDLNRPFSDAEKSLMKRETELMNVTVTVGGAMPGRKGLLECSVLPARQSWVQDLPTGYFYQNKWYLHHCRTGKISYRECLRNKKLLIFGDSTTRAWYKYLMERLPCMPITEKWWKEKWHKRAACVNENFNFTMEWLPHAQPFHVGEIWDSYRYTTHPIARHIDELADNDNVILVIHMFLHVNNYHKSIFQGRMRAISNSVKSLLTRNKLAKILIKGPHTFTGRITNFFVDVYRDILREEFEDLYDNVVFMEQADMTIAKNNAEIHPGRDIVEAAVNQMFGYICE